MKQIKLSGSLRENVGRTDASELRKKGRIPGVLYGGTEQISFNISEIDLTKILRLPDTLQINLEIGSKSYPTIIQEIQHHPVTDKVIHIDLLQLIPGKEVKTALPVRITGTSEGVRSGGKLMVNYRKVRIIGKPENLPEDIQIDISNMKIGDMVRIRELNVPGCRVLEAEASAVVAVEATRASIATTTADAAEEAKKKK
ncbi:MAG: 50S ribosomal protein L25 [Crocinitomicaceae bacterium]|nr:50S ribosomal protein L25 [Crocinitomicaceae bacterium]